MGKKVSVRLEMGLGAYSILIRRSFFVVSNRINGGWMMGIRLMYEYAATAMGASNSGASLDATKIEVGPSMAPMTPMDAASLSGKPNAIASMSVPKMPNCPAAPSRTMRGCASSGEKSIIAPTPIKISSGNNSVLIPASYNTPIMPSTAVIPESGILASKHPKPMGNKSTGSISLNTAR